MKKTKEYDTKLLDDAKRLLLARYPRFGAQIADANLEYKTDLTFHTAATDGKNIYFDPDFLASLSDDEKTFLIAHELMHVKFEHMYRMMDKNGQKRDPMLWNIATDAIINANLERDGFKIKEGYVNMPEALNYSAEEFYDKLLREKKEKEQEKICTCSCQKPGQNGNKSEQAQDVPNNGKTKESDSKDSSSGQNKGESSGKDQGSLSPSPEQSGSTNQNSENQTPEETKADDFDEQFADDHSLWEKAFGELQEENKRNETEPQTKFNEKDEFQTNRQERLARAKEYMERIRDQELKNTESEGNLEFGNLGEAKPVLNWKTILRKELAKTETTWSQRRSIAENNYAFRLEEDDVIDQAATEVIIDISDSVSLPLVKTFLKQLKPLLQESKLSVGCFNLKFWGMREIKSNNDIDNFKIPKAARDPDFAGTNWDLAVRSFSKKHEVNKIVFTDGEYPEQGIMPKSDLKGTNVFWIVYSNKDFHPCCGKVINVRPKELQNLTKTEQAAAEPELSMVR